MKRCIRKLKIDVVKGQQNRFTIIDRFDGKEIWIYIKIG